ncbi:MAG: ABC transporter permease [Actinomycetota bacterium]|nr:ABC transporter permease [Actinomycetota bacterium]
MNATVTRLSLRALLGRRRALLLVLLPGVLLLLAVVIRLLAGSDENITRHLLGAFALGTLVPLLGLITGTGVLGPEIDDGSVDYLLAKPISRPTIVRSKLLVAVLAVIVFAALPTLLAGLIMSGLAGGLAVGYAVGAVIAGVAYCALFLLLSVLTRNAVIVGLLYALIWETVLGGYVPGAQKLSIQQWALAVTRSITGSEVRSAVALPVGVTLLVVLFVGSIWYAGRRLSTLTLTSDE